MLAARLIGCFQSRTVDPQIYGVELAKLFLEFSPEEGEYAVDEMLHEDTKIPTVRRVIEVLKDSRAHLEWKKKRTHLALPKPAEYEGFVGADDERKIMGCMVGMVRQAMKTNNKQLHEEIKAVGNCPDKWLTFLHEHGIDPFEAKAA